MASAVLAPTSSRVVAAGGPAAHAEALAKALSRRSFAGALGPLLLASCLAYFLRGDQDLTFLVLAMLTLGIARGWVAFRQPALFAYRPALWFALFRGGALLTSVLWGVTSALVQAQHGLTGTLLVLSMTAGIAAGATVSLGPDLWTLRVYLLMLLAPLAVSLVHEGAPHAWPVIVSMAWFYVFLLLQARLLHDHFHRSLAAEAELCARAEALELASRQADEAKSAADAANRAKSTFLANMSHELRTPLTAIIGYAELLLGKVSPSERVEYAETIRRNGDHLLSLLNELLDLSKIEADKMSVVSEPVSVRSVLADVESLMRVRAVARGLALEVRADTPFPRIVQADGTRVRQILLNLVGNAIKFTQAGSVTVSVRVERGAQLAIDVRDTGPGMSQELQARLFEAFSQGESTSEVARSGTGLGLHVSQKLAQLMRGEIRMHSEPGKGSVFSLILPFAPGDASDMVSHAHGSLRPKAMELPEPSSQELASLRLLLAEDGPDNQRLLRAILSQAGASVHVVGDGEEAVSAALAAVAQGSPFHVVLMDMEMPVLDGYAATARLREQGYAKPIVALTAHAMAEHRERTRRVGCDGHLVKPVDRLALVDAISTLSGRRRPSSANAALFSTLGHDPMFQDLIPRYLESLARMSRELSEASTQSDRAGMARIAHQLAGTGGSYGFDVITDAARELEAALRERSCDTTSAVRQLLELCERAIQGRGATPAGASPGTALH